MDTPFEPNRNGSEIESLNVQDAIEEVKQDALNNDRFILLCSYNGNANTGRYLEFFSGIDSSIAPIFLSAPAKCITFIFASTANSTCSLGIFDLNISSTVPIHTINLNNQTRNSQIGSATAPLFLTGANSRIALRIISGSANRPHVYFTLSAST